MPPFRRVSPQKDTEKRSKTHREIEEAAPARDQRTILARVINVFIANGKAAAFSNSCRNLGSEIVPKTECGIHISRHGYNIEQGKEQPSND